MFDPLSLVGPHYDENQFINQLQAYNTWQPNDDTLDLYREIQASGNYYWQGLVFPDSSNRTVGPQATINGTLIVPAGTYVTSITHYSSLAPGFKFKLYDKGTKASIFYGDYALDRIVSSNMLTTGIYATVPTDIGSNQDIPFGPAMLLSPFIVTGPGVIGWEIVNLGTDNNIVNVLVACAVPITHRSIGTTIVSKG
jgi:hypothetical protein